MPSAPWRRKTSSPSSVPSGEEPGQFTWPNSLAADAAGNVYVTDEWLNRVTVFDHGGNYLSHWGEEGSGPGQLNRPAGIAFDAEDNLFLADSFNHRIQKFTREGQFLDQWGEQGSGDGQMNTPWGICLDDAGMVYVADWRNDRIQKFAPDGRFVLSIGGTGAETGRFNRPSGVAVDRDGYIYVCDWGNDRVQVFNGSGEFNAELLGDATMSKWGAQAAVLQPREHAGTTGAGPQPGPGEKVRAAGIRQNRPGRPFDCGRLRPPPAADLPAHLNRRQPPSSPKPELPSVTFSHDASRTRRLPVARMRHPDNGAQFATIRGSHCPVPVRDIGLDDAGFVAYWGNTLSHVGTIY